MMTDTYLDQRSAHLIAHLVGYTLGVSSADILARGRGSREVSKGRHLAMYLAHISFGWSVSRVASVFKRDRSTVGYACQLIEQERDDEAFDLWVSEMEEGLLKLVPLARRAA